MQTNVLTTLEALTTEEWDRLRFRLYRAFAQQLGKLPDAPETDDLLQEAIQDVIVGTRHCPLEKASLVNCLFLIVRSKVSHLYEKWQQTRIIKLSDEELDRHLAHETSDAPAEDLRDAIIARVADDPQLLAIVEYRLAHAEEEPLKAQRLAEVCGLTVTDVYNANRRLKARLASLL